MIIKGIYICQHYFSLMRSLKCFKLNLRTLGIILSKIGPTYENLEGSLGSTVDK